MPFIYSLSLSISAHASAVGGYFFMAFLPALVEGLKMMSQKIFARPMGECPLRFNRPAQILPASGGRAGVFPQP
jgi:hypothetical protein